MARNLLGLTVFLLLGLSRLSVSQVTSDAGCTDRKGTCQPLNELCIGGSYRRGLCAGADTRRCCSPFPTNDDECTVGKSGTCKQTSDGCSEGGFWVGLCSGRLNRQCCIPNAGCDPNLKDFRNLPVQENFDEAKLVGGWYQRRAYYPLSQTKEVFLGTNTARVDEFTRTDQGLSFITYAGNGMQCDAPRRGDFIKRSTGVYQSTGQLGRALSTFIHVDDYLLVEVVCYVPLDNGCTDFAAFIWSRCKDTRADDISKAVKVLEDNCYSELDRYVDQNFEPGTADCSPAYPARPGCEEIKEKEVFKGTCDINYAKLKPDPDFCMEQMYSLWYTTRYYLDMDSDVTDEHFDVSRYATATNIPNNMITHSDAREKTTCYCADASRRNITFVSPGIYTYVSGSMATNKVTIVYASKHLLIEFYCKEPSEEGCNYVTIVFWTPNKQPRPEDICKGEKILRDICYPDMRRFHDTKHEMDCSGHPSETKKKCGDDKKDKKKKCGDM